MQHQSIDIPVLMITAITLSPLPRTCAVRRTEFLSPSFPTGLTKPASSLLRSASFRASPASPAITISHVTLAQVLKFRTGKVWDGLDVRFPSICAPIFMVVGNDSEDEGLEGISPRVAMISHRMIRIAVFARFPASVPSLNSELVWYLYSFPLLWWQSCCSRFHIQYGFVVLSTFPPSRCAAAACSYLTEV